MRGITSQIQVRASVHIVDTEPMPISVSWTHGRWAGAPVLVKPHVCPRVKPAACVLPSIVYLINLACNNCLT